MKQYRLLLCAFSVLVSVTATFGAGDNGLRPILLALGLDSARSVNAAEATVALDSIAAGTGHIAEVAAGAAFILRGKDGLGISTLKVAVGEATDAHPAFMAAADYLIERDRTSDTTATGAGEALRAKADYLARVGVPQVDVYLELARLSLAEGDLNQAAESLEQARSNSSAADSAALQEMAALYSGLVSATLARENSKSGRWKFWVPIILALASLATVAYVVRRGKRAEGAETTETQDNTSQLNASGAMLDVALFAGEKYRDFSVLVERKLAAGQSKDLYNLVSGGKSLALFRGEFLEAFDQAFLKAYPDFSRRLNSLLKEDSALEFAGKLSPEERIAALISLGNDGSSELAQILGLSLNTVYTYRNRLRGRALDRGTFEENLKTLLK